MMNKHIRMMIDEIFSEMRMTAENLALRDEMLANALARFEDAVAMGKTPDEAFSEVAASLGDVQALLAEINGNPEADRREEEPADQEKPEAQRHTTEKDAQQGTDLGEALNKAFSVLEDWGRQVMPQTKKFVRQVDDAAGGMIKDIGRAAKKGLRDAQKAAEETLDRLAGEKGELIFDFGAKRGSEQKTPEENPQDMQAEQHEDAGEETHAEETHEEEIPEEETSKTGIDENGDIQEEDFLNAVEEIVRDAQTVVEKEEKDGECAKDDPTEEAEYIVQEADEPVCGSRTFPAVGLHQVDIRLDADDVRIEPAQNSEIEMLWEARNIDGEPTVEMNGHTLVIRRKNPDVFKTFFSAFQKKGGKITLRVPVGYAAVYAVSTTSGDVTLRGLDADEVKIHTTSGCVRVETLTSARAEKISVTTILGHAAVSACADDIAVTTVSGNQFISCDARRVEVNVVSGKVHGEGACEEWEIDAVSSDVELLCTVAPTRKIQIASMHGTVRLALPADIRGFVAKSNAAMGCPIVNEFGSNRYGTCALPIEVDTLRGQLVITRL